jgi:proton glutamate symport protein
LTAEATPEIRAPRPLWVLGALVAGILLGIAAAGASTPVRTIATEVASTVGGLWLNALEMTVVPLIVALLITGIAQSAEAARGGRIAGRAVLWLVILSTVSAIMGMALSLLLVRLVPVSAETAAALRTNAALQGPAPSGAGESVGSFFHALIPQNVFSAAANSDVLALVVATLLFGLAATRIAASRRKALVDFFAAVTDAFLVIIGWVLWFAPLGVFALAFGLGAAAGGLAFATHANYILLVHCLIHI